VLFFRLTKNSIKPKIFDGKAMQQRSLVKQNDLDLRFFSTIATLGTPYDITLQEIRIECLFPADEETERNWSFV
jgi:hypothetical protein